MDESSERYGQEQTKKSEDAIINIGNDPVMLLAVDVLSVMGSRNQVILRAKGNSIPNADRTSTANSITGSFPIFMMVSSDLLVCS